MSVVIEKLQRARALAWADLVPAFDHAIVLAEEAEATAERAANEAQVSTSPAYPALVMKLAAAVRDEPVRGRLAHVVTQQPPWPSHSEATRNRTRFRCSCGWAGQIFADARDAVLERQNAWHEAEQHVREVSR